VCIELDVCCVQLSQVGAEHAGTYTVTATNRVASVSTTATLTVSQGARFVTISAGVGPGLGYFIIPRLYLLLCFP